MSHQPLGTRYEGTLTARITPRAIDLDLGNPSTSVAVVVDNQ